MTANDAGLLEAMIRKLGKLSPLEDQDRAALFFAKARDLEKRSKVFHDLVLNHESLSGDNLGQP